MPDILHLRNVKKTFRQPDGSELHILDVPDFCVSEGEQVILVGPSGCGKTTLLHVIAGISRPDSGKVRIDDFDITLMSEAECDRFRAERIGYVFQTFNLLPAFTALENVLLAMRFARGRPNKPRARQLLERVGLGHRMTHRPRMLSVGEQQRVAVARALANKPKLVLADEPTGNLDHKNARKSVTLIREACRENGTALLLVSHDRETLSQFEQVREFEHINQVSPEEANL